MTTDERKQKIIEALGECGGNVSQACEIVGISRKTYYQWRKEDPLFAGKCDGIIAMFAGAKAMRQTPKPEPPAAPLPEDESMFAPYVGRPSSEIRKEEAERIRTAMRDLGTYAPAFEPMILTAASQCALVVMAAADLDRYAYMQIEVTSTGAQKLACNPAYNSIAKLTEAYVRTLGKLGLDFDPKRAAPEGDFFSDLNKALDND